MTEYFGGLQLTPLILFSALRSCLSPEMGYLAGSAASLLKSGVKQVILSSYLNSLASDWEGAAELGTHKAGIGHLFLERFSSPCSLPAYVCSV